jgi:hypothetical protein
MPAHCYSALKVSQPSGFNHHGGSRPALGVRQLLGERKPEGWERRRLSLGDFRV